MNISSIIGMIQNDPKITNDIEGFIKRMNEKNLKRIEKSHVVVEDIVTMVSIADSNGGDATIEDVQKAIDIINSKPLSDEADDRIAKVKAAIDSGDITTTQEMIALFGE